MSLYVNQFTLYPLNYVSHKTMGDNYLLEFYQPNLRINYNCFFGVNTSNDKLVAKLKPGIECVVYGTIKTKANGDTILRAKQIVVDEY